MGAKTIVSLNFFKPLMKNLIIFSFCWCMSLPLYAQVIINPRVNVPLNNAKTENQWHKGTAYISTGDTIDGNLKFDLQQEILQIEVAGLMKTLTVRKITGFKFFDTQLQRERYYYTLPFAKVQNYETPTFFEAILQGSPITLLCREMWVTQTYTNNNPYSYGYGYPQTYTTLQNNFYFLNKSGKIRSFDGTKKGLLELLQDRESEIKEYIKKNNVNFNSKQDMSDLMMYYNALKK
jgi:hypothetical protein